MPPSSDLLEAAVSDAPGGAAEAADIPSEPAAKPKRLSDLFGNLELLIVILLGVVSVFTAYASFQAALYDGHAMDAFNKGQRETTAAESVYLEANQQYILDVQTWNELTLLGVDMDNSNPEISQAASDKSDLLYFQSVGEDFDAAINWSIEQNEADPASYTSPFDSEEYMDAMFSSYWDDKAAAEALIVTGDSIGALSDRLTLNTVLMALSLFLLGIAAVVRSRRSQIVLAGVATVVFLGSAIATLVIPPAAF